ncbi:MAG TPA: hypothetical protein VMM84_14410, partial [Pyrinomonadaceae bacterium]|nr:hypothetical protein [Pyrinomonadaceae bacterium]
MKRQITLMTLAIATCLIWAGSVQAQSKQAFTVNIPFHFVIENETYNPGEYKIERLNPQNPRMLVLEPVGEKGRKI